MAEKDKEEEKDSRAIIPIPILGTKITWREWEEKKDSLPNQEIKHGECNAYTFTYQILRPPWYNLEDTHKRFLSQNKGVSS